MVDKTPDQVITLSRSVYEELGERGEVIAFGDPDDHTIKLRLKE